MTIQTDIRKTAKASIWLDEDGFLWVKPNKGVEMEGRDVELAFKVYEELGCKKKKVPQIIDGREDFTMSKEGREYAATHAESVFIASAMITESLAIRLIVNFFNRFYKTPVPFKSFPTETEAKIWLRSIKG
ncbi:MAG: hypothetical protein ACHQRM_08040 [Bacteroidia bacterium]